MRTEKAYPIKPNPMRSSRNKIQLGVFSTKESPNKSRLCENRLTT
ncbi:hypothetical protein [Pseudomonas amygdali]